MSRHNPALEGHGKNPGRYIIPAALFWPLFMGATIAEERFGLAWLTTSEPRLWLPLAAIWLVACVLFAILRPVLVRSRLLEAFVVICAFASSYALVVAIGALFLSWGD
jgi:hypothetical protein